MLPTEFLLMGTLLVLGILAGLMAVRDAVVVELEELGRAFDCLPVVSPEAVEDQTPGQPTVSTCSSGPAPCSTVGLMPPIPCPIDAAICP
jgi:hypothetical protein